MIMAIDLGTKLGFAIGLSKIERSGAVNLKKYAPKGGTAFQGLFPALDFIKGSDEVESVVVEIIRSHGKDGVKAAHFYGAVLYSLRAWCFENKIPIKYAEVSHIKRFFTGKGNATKQEMVKYARMHKFQPKTFDEADAIAIWYLAKNNDKLLKDKI